MSRVRFALPPRTEYRAVPDSGELRQKVSVPRYTCAALLTQAVAGRHAACPCRMDWLLLAVLPGLSGRCSGAVASGARHQYECGEAGGARPSSHLGAATLCRSRATMTLALSG